MNFGRYIEHEMAFVKRMKLENGATILFRQEGSPGVVSIGCFLRMGSLYEGDETAGYSNLLQALMLKGTSRLKSYDLARELESLGARTASSSGKELGKTSMISITDNLGPSLELFMEIITDPLLDEEEFEKEKQIAIEEIKRDYDQFLSRAFTIFQEHFYGEHPFHKNVLGYETTISKATLGDIRDYYDMFYTPRNLVFSVVGDVDAAKLSNIIEKYTSGMEQTDVPEPPVVPASDIRGPGTVNNEYRDSEAAWIVVGFPAPSLNDDLHAACNVMASVLGGSMNSRLFMELREKKALAYQVSATYNSYLGPSFIAGYIGTSADRSKEARDSLEDEMKKLAGEGVSEDEVSRSINYLIGNYMINSELSSGLASRYGRFESLGVGYDFGARYIEALTRVKPAHVRDVASSFLNESVTGAILPKELEP